MKITLLILLLFIPLFAENYIVINCDSLPEESNLFTAEIDSCIFLAPKCIRSRNSRRERRIYRLRCISDSIINPNKYKFVRNIDFKDKVSLLGGRISLLEVENKRLEYELNVSRNENDVARGTVGIWLSLLTIAVIALAIQ